MADGSRTADYTAAIESWRADAQFSVDYSKRFLGLEHAYARGLSGKGQTIGINDAGIYMNHPLFQTAGKITGLHTEVPSDYGNDGAINPRRPWEGHGTHVAGTAAGNRTTDGLMFGNAYGANIYAATANFAAGDFLWWRDAIIDEKYIQTSYDNIIDLAETGKVRIINNSWGSQTSVRFDASLQTILANLGDDYEDFFDPILKNDVLVVFSAGNGGGVHAGATAVIPLAAPELRSNWLSVVNYNESLLPDPSSSLCGRTATYCVAGPGADIISSVPGYEYNIPALLAAFPVASFSTLYNARTVAQLNAAAQTRVLNALNNYLNQKALAARLGQPFDEQAARKRVVDELVAVTFVAGALINTPDGVTSLMGNILSNANNVALLSEDFSRDILTKANDEFLRRLDTFVNFTGPGYEAYTGTSMAAPNISGFAAVLMEAFPEYNTALITDILLSSSKDLDTPGVDLKSGWGAPQMDVALGGPTALRAVRDVTVNVGTVDVWTNDIGDARDRYSAEVLADFPDDIGGLVKKGGGELVLTGNIDYTGVTRVEGGLLTVNGAILRSDTTVADVGIIGGTGTLANLTADAGGVVAPGNAANPFGTLTVTGDATFNPDSFLWVRSAVNGTAYSKLKVGGEAILNGGNVILKADQGTWNLRTRLNIVSADGGVTGAFAGSTSDLAFLMPKLTYTDNTVVLTLLRNDVLISSVGKTPNERAVGGALDVMTAQNTTGDLTLENAILDGSVANVAAALSSFTGEVHASLGGVAVSDSRYIRDAMLQRGRGAPANETEGRGVNAWASGVFGNGEFEGDNELAGYRSDSTGYLAGLEKAWSGRAHLGLAVGETRTEITANSLRSSGTARNQHIGLYGGMNAGAFALRVGGSWIDANLRTNRTAALNQFNNQLTGHYDGKGWQAYGEIAWRASFGASTIEPYTNYTRVDYHADVAEVGGDAALSGRVEQVADLVTAGFRTETILSQGAGRPTLTAVTHLAWSHDFNDDGPEFRAKFADGPIFQVAGANIGQDALLTGLGVNIQANDRTNVEVGYAGVYQDDYNDNKLFARLNVKF